MPLIDWPTMSVALAGPVNPQLAFDALDADPVPVEVEVVVDPVLLEGDLIDFGLVAEASDVPSVAFEDGEPFEGLSDGRDGRLALGGRKILHFMRNGGSVLVVRCDGFRLPVVF